MIFDIKKRRFKLTAKACILSILFQVGMPNTGFSQSSGSSQTETFGGSGSSNMVDLFTGDFSYSIPLMDVDGFPIVLQYNGNVSMNQEASWVGLGWSLNPGAINREMRGLPDDFDGDVVTRTLGTKEDKTKGLLPSANNAKNIGSGLQYSPPFTNLGLFSVGGGFEQKGGYFKNTYYGVGSNYQFIPSANISVDIFKGALRLGAGGNLGFGFNSRSGIGWSKGGNISAAFNKNPGKIKSFGLDVSASVNTTNSTRGTKQKFISSSIDLSASMYGASISGGRSVSFGTKTYTPVINFRTTGTSSFNRFAAGYFGGFLATPGTFWIYGLTEFYNSNFQTSSETQSNKAYGYNNLEKGIESNESLLDFNRENQGKVSTAMKVLPVTNLTYDLFSMSGAGASGQFRSHRNDIGTVANASNISLMTGANTAVEAGAGVRPFPPPLLPIPTFKFSNSLGTHSANSQSNPWGNVTYNAASSSLSFKDVYAEDAENETYFYKQTGELIPFNSSFFDQYGGDEAVKLSLYNDYGDAEIASYNNVGNVQVTFPGNINGNSYSLPSQNYQSGKQNRNTLISEFSAKESSECLGFESDIISYNKNADSEIGLPTLMTNYDDGRTTDVKKDHHISEFQVTKPSGERCIYNIPVYTVKEKQVTYNATGNTTDYTNGLVALQTDDNTTNNTNGRDNLYNATEIPGYAHSFLMRAMLSHDYNDRTGNGLSEDDYGSYIKFNYTQEFGESNPFKWKTPYNDNTGMTSPAPAQANYQDINKSYDDDEMGQYVYGEKEMYYVNSIEGKNYIAIFYTEDRQDLVSVSNEGGQFTSANDRGQLLDKIVLYNKEDLKTNGEDAEPIQTVHFVYDYSLCKDYYGNVNAGSGSDNSGKLTLKEVYFTYSSSKKGRLTPYEFVYGGSNPNFNPGKVDRWGVYHDETVYSLSALNNTDFPYSEQNQSNRDDASAAWSITKIKLPSGGEIDITYESDDYAYTQNQVAMEMFPIRSMSSENEETDINDPQNDDNVFRPLNKRKKPHDIIYIDLKSAYSSAANHTEAVNSFYNDYLKEIVEKQKGYIFHKTKFETKFDNGDYEYVQGFVKYKSHGIVDDGTYDIGWIQIETEDVSDESGNYQVNPIMKQAWQHLRLNVPYALYPPNNIGANGLDWSTLFNGLNRALNNKAFALRFQQGQSFLRLNTPDRKKLGGGNRVKMITSNDSWNDMTSDADFEYGQEYFYTNESGESNGVAAYEPTIGNEINPLRQPVEYTIKNEKMPDDQLYHIGPFGESFYEAPTIGYSGVKVRNLERKDGLGAKNVTRTATGWTVHEYYTSKDFPTIVERTGLEMERLEVEPNVLQALTGGEEIDLMGASQGFSISKNDMHGKMKMVTSFNEAGFETSSVLYDYQDVNETSKTIDKSGTISEKLIGKDIDIVVDAQQTNTLSQTEAFSFFAQYAGSGIPSFGGGVNMATVKEGYVLCGVTKVIHNYAVLDKVVTRHLGSEVTQRNLAFDAVTGNVLVSSSTNEYNKEVYSTAFPSHWYYPGMSNACETYNNHLDGNFIATSGEVDLTGTGYQVEDLFYPGDEIITEDPEGSPVTCMKAWVLSIDDVSNTMILIDEDGTPLSYPSGINGLRVVRSGHRNQQMIPMSSFASLDDPRGSTDIEIPNDVLNASAVTFSQNWSILGAVEDDCGNTPSTCLSEDGDIVNPYLNGLLGNWRMRKSFVYQVDREENATASAVDLRTGGTYDDFISFYEYNSTNSAWYTVNSADHPSHSATDFENWLLVNTVENYDDNGSAIEATDVIDRHSAVLYGYHNNSRTVPVAVADNAQPRDLAYDGFEDYTYFDHNINGATCRAAGHLDFVDAIGGTVTIASETYHTGRHCLRLEPGDEASVSRSRSLCATIDPYTSSGYEVQCDQLLDRFYPTGGEYVISVWVKIEAITPTSEKVVPKIEITSTPSIGSPTTVQITSLGKEVIEGWQKLEGVVSLSGMPGCIEISLQNNSSNHLIYYDDFRVHPFNSTMVSHVYDPLSLRKWADLNDYNFGTIYEYNEQGLLVRVKQETIEGIKTISESRSGLIK